MRPLPALAAGSWGAVLPAWWPTVPSSGVATCDPQAKPCVPPAAYAPRTWRPCRRTSGQRGPDRGIADGPCGRGRIASPCRGQAAPSQLGAVSSVHDAAPQLRLPASSPCSEILAGWVGCERRGAAKRAGAERRHAPGTARLGGMPRRGHPRWRDAVGVRHRRRAPAPGAAPSSPATVTDEARAAGRRLPDQAAMAPPPGNSAFHYFASCFRIDTWLVRRNMPPCRGAVCYKPRCLMLVPAAARPGSLGARARSRRLDRRRFIP